MSETETVQFSSLLKLLDDDSPVVQEAIGDALEEMSDDLTQILDELDTTIDPPQLRKIESILAERNIHLNLRQPRHIAADKEKVNAKFKLGQLVRHRKYGYRGVIVDFDAECQADERWYRSNQTQPDRDQPWYHVLVHDSYQVTYAAESSLIQDISDEPVVHPLVTKFFSRFENGHYIRNDHPWPYQW